MGKSRKRKGSNLPEDMEKIRNEAEEENLAADQADAPSDDSKKDPDYLGLMIKHMGASKFMDRSLKSIGKLKRSSKSALKRLKDEEKDSLTTQEDEAAKTRLERQVAQWDEAERGLKTLLKSWKNLEDPSIMEMDVKALLGKDLNEASNMPLEEAEYYSRSYYRSQKVRIAIQHQIRNLKKKNHPFGLLDLMWHQFKAIEEDVVKVMEQYSMSTDLGVWLRSIHGIGPVLSSALLSGIRTPKAKTGEIRQFPTVGKFWAFAGLWMGAEWDGGELRPWNTPLKVKFHLCADQFVRGQGSKKDIYGKYYVARKEYDTQRNESGAFAERAAKMLEAGDQRDAKAKDDTYKKSDARKAHAKGKLTSSHITSMAKLWVKKLFAAHVWEAFRRYDGLPVPKPYPIQWLGHTKIIIPPNLHLLGIDSSNLQYTDYVPIDPVTGNEVPKDQRKCDPSSVDWSKVQIEDPAPR